MSVEVTVVAQCRVGLPRPARRAVRRCRPSARLWRLQRSG